MLNRILSNRHIKHKIKWFSKSTLTFISNQASTRGTSDIIDQHVAYIKRSDLLISLRTYHVILENLHIEYNHKLSSWSIIRIHIKEAKKLYVILQNKQ